MFVLYDTGFSKAPVTQDGDHAATMATERIHQIAVWSPNIRKNAPLCDCNRDRAALARRSDARPLWAQLRFHYDLCVRTTLIPQTHGALDTRSVRPSTTLQRCYYDIGDRTTLLGRSRRVCCAHTASVLRSYGDHRRFAVYLAPFHGKLEFFQFSFKCKYEVFYLENESWFHSSLNHLFSNKLQC